MTRIKWTREISGALTAHWPDGQEWTFSRPGGGYVYCDEGVASRHGTLGRQICYGGHFSGSTVHERDDDAFEREVRRWLRDHRRFAATLGV